MIVYIGKKSKNSDDKDGGYLMDIQEVGDQYCSDTTSGGWLQVSFYFLQNKHGDLTDKGQDEEVGDMHPIWLLNCKSMLIIKLLSKLTSGNNFLGSTALHLNKRPVIA